MEIGRVQLQPPVLYEAVSGYCGTLLELVYELSQGLVC